MSDEYVIVEWHDVRTTGIPDRQIATFFKGFARKPAILKPPAMVQWEFTLDRAKIYQDRQAAEEDLIKLKLMDDSDWEVKNIRDL